MNVGGAGDNNNNPSPNNNPPPLPPRPIQPPSNFAPHSQQLFVSQQPPPFIPYNNANGVYNYNCYQQGPSFTNPWSVAQPKHNFLMVAEAIESVVNALVSVANMLNTTHNAVFNSFRAVAGVAQQFRTFRIYMFTAILVPVLRWCRFLWRHFLSFLRVRPRNYAKSEAIWTTIQQQEGVNGDWFATGRRVHATYAVTGNVGETGRLQKIEGLQPKTEADIAAGKREVIMPLGNKKDWNKIPLRIRRLIQPFFLCTIRQVLEKMLI
uniref:Peroxin-13 n=1 Tax=Globodera rostochiensis TaxID=31243 RepID=A0A914I5E7_GLORO